MQLTHSIQASPLHRAKRGNLLRSAFLAIIAGSFGIAHASPSDTVVISQVYGGGGNNDAPFTHDFVELHNISNSAVDVTGWSIQYASATGSSWNAFSLSGTIGAGGYFLIQLASTGSNGTALPTPDMTGTINLAQVAGKVALVNGTTALSGADPVGSPGLVDFLGYGTTANAFEGTGPTASLNSSTSASRLDFGSQDTDHNSVDFETLSPPQPRNSASMPYIPSPPAGLLITVLTPANGAIDVPIGTDLVFTFNQSIQAGTGDLAVYAAATDALVESVAITSAMIEGNVLTVTPPAPLAYDQAFYVLIEAGAVEDLNGEPFAGISASSDWTFTTTGVPPVADDFAAWIAGFDVGGLTGPSDDPDGDGIPNLLEHVLGLAPDAPNAGSSVVAGESGAGTVTFVHTRIKPENLASDVIADYEWSVNLTDWVLDGESLGGVAVAFGEAVVVDAGNPEFDVVEVTATVTAGTAGKLFVRIAADIATE